MMQHGSMYLRCALTRQRCSQDDVPSFDDAQAFAIMEEELGRPLASVFSSISEHPIAAASLGQVCAAGLGTLVPCRAASMPSGGSPGRVSPAQRRGRGRGGGERLVDYMRTARGVSGFLSSFQGPFWSSGLPGSRI